MALAMAVFVFYGKISQNHELTLPNDREFDLLSIGALDFWDPLWLGLWPFLYFMEGSRKMVAPRSMTPKVREMSPTVKPFDQSGFEYGWL